MITNHYLFSSQFRTYLQAQQLDDEEFFGGFKDTVSSFLQSAAHDTLDRLTQQVIAPILSQLQFAHAPFTPEQSGPPAAYSYVFDGFPLENTVSCVYVTAPHPRPLSQRERGDSSPLPLGEGPGVRADERFPAEKGYFPAFELIYRLKQAGLEWGILTDGVVWRLYSTRSPLPYEQFLEIDFSDPQEEDFRVFWQLFSLTLFLPDEDDVTPLQTYIEESAKEAEVIEKHIKDNIEEILENICVGLLTYGGHNVRPLSDTEQQTYFENAVYLLFRLLFVLYAESRDLLPMQNPAYREHSLQVLLHQAREWLRSGVANPDGTELWDAFRDLCTHIEGGDRALGIPEYNGGLFDSREHAFLSDAHNKVKNLYFVKVLYRLGYRHVGKRPKSGVQSSLCDQAIDYRDLSVRSLGSLYEGILEYKLFIAEEELVVRKKEILPTREAGKIKKSEWVIAPGQVYFAQAANERHDTGSYYTPEYVVEYMVQNSVRVGLEERWQAFQPTLAQYAQEFRRASSEDLREALLKKLDQELLRFVEEQALTFKVVDPAMGSGHFLVNALNTITHFILHALQVRVGPHPQPLSQRERGTLPEREPEIPSWEGQGWVVFHHNPAIDLTPAMWRRKVVERCIFGVDINPLAAELAKLSLWIASADAGKPLTFLNHHLKDGDSILGIRLEDMLTYPERKPTPAPSQEGNVKQTTIWDVIDKDRISTIKEQFQHFLSSDSNQMEQILSKKDAYAEITHNPLLNHLKDMATLWLLISLDVNRKKSRDLFDSTPQYPDETQYFDLLGKTQAIASEAEWEQALGVSLYAAIKEYQHRQRLCHWELEFPEIINEGFDAVISNPPYIRQEKLGTQKAVLQYLYPNTYSGSGDLYIYFFDRGFQVLKQDCLLSFIASNKWTRAKYGEPFRRFLLDKTTITCYLDFSELPVFGKVTVSTSTIVLQKNIHQTDFHVCKFGTDFEKTRNFNPYINRHAIRYAHANLELEAFSFANPIAAKLKQKMEDVGTFLKEWKVSIYRGITTGANEVFVIDGNTREEFITEDFKNEEIIKPILRGRDIKRYTYNFDGKWLIFTRRGISIKAYPSIEEYLYQFYDQLRPKNNNEPIGRKPGPYEWYEIQDNSNYYLEFEKEKIVWIDLSDKANFALDTEKHYTLNTSFIMTGESLKYLLACLNSKLSEWYFHQISTSSGAGTTRWIKYKIEQLLIPKISETEQQPFTELVDQILTQKKKNEDTTTLEEQIDRMVYDLYGLTPEEIAVVEGEGN